MSRDPTSNSPKIYAVTIRGYLRQDWEDWFGDLVISHSVGTHGGAVTLLTGPFADQSALHGLLSQLHSLNLELVSVTQLIRE